MATGEIPTPGRVSLEHLIALNDEIAALIRAGIPLERGLVEAGGDVGGRLGALERAIGERAGRGEALPEALAAAGGGMPDLYRAIVTAGLRSGHLARALEGLATHARGVAEARRLVGQAMLYPLMILGLAYALFLGFVWQIAPRFVAAFTALGLPPFAPLLWFERIGRSVALWGPILPAAFVVLGLAWLASGRSRSLDPGRGVAFARRIPGVGPMLAQARNANFADLLALLVEHDVPLVEGIPLAADASGDPALRREARALADRLAAGDVAAGRGGRGGAIPPLLDWMLRAGTRQATLAPALRHAAVSYRRKAMWRAGLLRTALPVVLLLGIGAVAVLVYGLLMFIPLSTMLRELGQPTN
ncbi:type II secretion system F family protein [Tundrisphaera sp. TA3]|uniref:type II secretion system F family protein n=1 Tax=Tundrisphaera sp. TA3 TaxID=3435775 RepID=UPI003EC0A574